MDILILLSILTLALTYLEAKGVMKNGMLVGFILLTIVLGIRFEYGNDYISYCQKFNAYGPETFKFSALIDGTISDPLWYLLNRLFYPLGFETMIMFLTIISSYTYYRLIRFLPSDLWVFGVFIYLFSSSFMPIQLSMLRQSLAMCLVILATLSVLDKKVLLPIIILLAASGIHSSCMFCLPFIFLLYLDFSKYKKIVLLCFICLFVLFFIAKRFLFDVLGSTLDSIASSIDSLVKYEDKYLYGGAYEASESKSILGFILYLFPVVVNSLYLVKSKDEKMVKLSILYLLGSFVFLLDQIIPMVGRMAWYFTVFSIVTLPISFKAIRNRYIRYGLIALFIVITLREYNMFFHAINWKDAYLDFKTIFSK